jgi:hypothetical protein
MSGSIPSASNFSIGSAFQAIQGIWRDMALLKKQIPSYAEGIVTGVSPLEVTPDGSTEPVLITRTLASVKAGDRVQIRYHNNRCTLLAVVGGGITAVVGAVTLLPRSPVSVSLLPATVVFDRPFKTAPNVQVTMTGASGSSQLYVPRAYSITGAGFTVGIYTGNGSNATVSQPVNWLAVGELA